MKERHKSARRPSPFERVKQKNTGKKAQNESRNADIPFKPKRGTIEELEQSVSLLDQKPKSKAKFDKVKDFINIEKFDPTPKGQKVTYLYDS